MKAPKELIAKLKAQDNERSIEVLGTAVSDPTPEALVLALTRAISASKERPKSAPFLDPQYPYSFFLEFFFRRYRDLRDHYDRLPKKALVELEAAIGYCQTTDSLQELLFGLYKLEFRNAFKGAIDDFLEFNHKDKVTVIHLSCQKYIDNAFTSARSFDGRYFNNVTLVGCNDLDAGYHFDVETGVLTLPAFDFYENLSEKMAAAFKFLAFAGFDCPCLKVDDDIRCADSRLLADRVRSFTSSYDCGGKLVSKTKEHGISRWWHAGKCSDSNLNQLPYTLIPPPAYVQGGFGYILSPKAVQILGKAAIFLKDEFLIQRGTEDIAVSKVLLYFDIDPQGVDFFAEGLLRSVAEEPWFIGGAKSHQPNEDNQ